MKKFYSKKVLLSIVSIGALFTGFANFDSIVRIFAPQGTVTGVVFRDFNYNGIKDPTVAASGTTAGYNEPFLAGITVNAYNDAGTLVGTAVTTGTGPSNYTLSGASVTGKLRLEFVGLETGDFSTKSGTNNGTTVQFVDATASATADLGVIYPDDYSSTTNPNFTFTKYLAGSGVGNTGFAYQQLPYNASNATPAETNVTGATFDAVGALWGVAYNKTKKLSYTSAYVKRHVGIGDRGYDGIYVYDQSLATPALVGGIDLQGVVPANGGAAIDFGTVTRTLVSGNGTGVNDISSTQTSASRDSDAYAKVGKVGYGDIDYDQKNDLLWAVNLAERSIISIDMSTNIHAAGNPNTVASAKVNRYFLSAMAGFPAASSGTLRPFALKIYRGKVYVGLVDDGASLSNSPSVDMTASQKAYVVSFDAATPGALTTVTSLPLNYNRERSWVPFTPGATFDALESDNWQRWIDTYTDPATLGQTADATSATQDFKTGINGVFVGAPQPMLADIEFDNNGNIILGFQDRFASQHGWAQYLPSVTNTTTRSAVSHGDILMGYKSGSTFVFEGPNENDNFTTPDVVAANAQPGQELNDGPSGAGEFFRSDAFIGGDATHPETSFGAMAYLPGTQEILSTTFDPNAFNSQGFRWFSQNTGFETDYYATDLNTSLANFGKGQDLGDVELITAAAPIEIGNRVWADTDGDGIQDPSELPIANVTLELFADFNNDGVPDGAALGTVTTNSTGNYYFNDANVADGDPTTSGAQLGMQPDKRYIIRVATSDWTAGAGTGDLLNKKLTTADATSTGATDLADSDATLVATIPQISVLTGGVGENNHTLDMGFFEPVSLGSTVFQDINNDGTHNATEVGLAGAVVTLYQADGVTPVPGVASITTDATGNYFFSGLAPGQYVVGVLPPAAWPTSSSTTVTTDITTDDGKDNGTQSASGLEAKSPVITLAIGTEPTGATENGTGTGGALDNAAGQIDANGDMTVDFGFYAPVSIGSTVFNDANNNGIQDATEVGILGAVVTLYQADGITPVAGVTPQTTTGTGAYYFGNLAPGSYVVGVTPPATIPISSTNIATSGADNQTDSDDNGTQASPGAEAKSPVILLNSTTEPTTAETGTNETPDDTTPIADSSGDMTVDFGFYTPVSVGSTVFFDENNNGVQDGTEVGIAGATVKLYYDANGNGSIDGAETTAIATAPLTDGTGNYYFSNLSPGNYVVGVTPPSTYPVSSTNIATSAADNQTDADDNGTQAVAGGEALSPIINLQAGSEPTGLAENAPGTGGEQDAAADNAGDMTIDFGFYKPVSIGSVVFNDTNNNGQFDGTESGLAGAVVRLYYADGTPVPGVPAQTTNGTGTYYFGNLQPGNYKVGVTPPASAPTSSGPTVTTDDGDTGGGDNLDNGTQATSGAEAFSPVINLSAGKEPQGSNESGGGGAADDAAGDDSGDMTVDFGFFQSVSIGSTVFIDENNDGIQQPGESGLAGATVKLYYDANGNNIIDGAETTPIATAPVTNGTGLYYFEGLAPGNYKVGVTPPATHPASSTNIATSTADNQTDGDDNGTQTVIGAEALSPIINLTAGLEPAGTQENAPGAGGAQDTASGDTAGDMTIDFGFYTPVSIGSTVFIDSNNNGTQDANDLPLAGAIVTLYLADGVTPVPGVAPITTLANGNYFFQNLAPGNYVIGVLPPASHPLSSTTTVTTDITTDDGKDNGTQTTFAGEAKSPVINLKATTEPTGSTETPQGTGGTQDDGFDDAGDMTVDFGFFAPVSIGSTVFKDVNNDGIQSGAAETGIASATVNLYFDSNGDGLINGAEATTPFATKQTDANGDYIFDNIPEGKYIVGVVPTSAFPISSDNIGTSTADNQTDSDDNGSQTVSGAQAFSPVITLTYLGENGTEAGQGGGQDTASPGGDTSGDMTIDFGFYAPVSVGSTVFIDANNNGVQDATEIGLAGATVKLYQADGVTPVAGVTPIITDATGNYYFANLKPGNYVVGVTPPAAYPNSSDDIATSTADNQTDADDNGSQATAGAEAKSPVISLISNAEPADAAEGGPGIGGDADNTFDIDGDMTIDFGFYAPVSIGSTVFKDVNNDGTQSGANEIGIAGAVVTLYQADGITPVAGVSPITTGADGNYYFSNLKPGSYVVGVLPPANYPTSSTNIGTSTADNQTDGDDNGTQTASGAEAKSPVIVLASDAEPADAAESAPGTGGDADNGTESDNDGDMTVDFGFFTPMSLGSTVFNDKNNNGVQEAGELGIAGATVQLYNAAGAPIGTPIVTDATGNYLFSGLTPGSYMVGVTPPAAFPTSSNDIASTNTPDGDVDGDDNGVQAGGSGTEAKSGLIVLVSDNEPTEASNANIGGEEQDNATPSSEINGNMTLDFGFFAPMSIGSLVYIDSNNDGDQDAGELPLAGATVTLYQADGVTPATDANGNPIAPIVTQANGLYYFANLLEGNYVVGVTPPATYPTASATAVTTDDNGGDGLNNGTQAASGGESKSPVISLVAGTESSAEAGDGGNQDSATDGNAADLNGDMTVDFGFFTPVSVGSLVYIDANNNGDQDMGELPLAGALVKLYKADGITPATDANGNTIAAITTVADGLYYFANLLPGDYVVGVTPPATYPAASTTAVTADDNGGDGLNNGTQATPGTGEAKSPVITLTPETESDGESGPGGDQDIAGDTNGDMTVDFGFYAQPVNVSGNVFIDTNGPAAVDGAPYPAPANSLYAILVDATGNIAGSAPILPNGTFTIPNVLPGTYTSILSTSTPGAAGTPAPTVATIPTGYFNIAQGIGTVPDGNNNGIQSTPIVVTTMDVPLINFSINTSAPLPIDLVSFGGVQVEEQINLNWKVANEKEFSHFDLEKSTNAKEFGSIASITGVGKSTYNYSDLQPTEGDNYYRLKMVDLNGKTSLSKVVNINFEKNGSFISVENPASNGQFKVFTNLKNPKFTLLNSLGAIMPISSNLLSKNNFQLSTVQPISGVYYLNIVSEGKVVTKKVIMP